MSKSRKKNKAFSELKKGFSKKPIAQVTQESVKEKEALARISQGKIQEAEDIYRELINSGTENHTVYGNLAALCGMKGQTSEMIALLKIALQKQPNYPEAHNNLGIALKTQGDYVAAISSYKQAIRFKSDYPEAHNNLGIALKEQGDSISAISSYKKAIRIKPNYPEAHYNLANALKTQGDYVAAISSYKQAIQLKPSYPEAHCNLGLTLQEQGDSITAISSYKKAIRIKPNYPEAHCNLGIALNEQGDSITAIDSFKQAIHLKPSYPEPYCNLGIALHEQGEFNSAIALYNQAIQLKPDYVDAHFNLSLTQLLIENYQEGWKNYRWRLKRKDSQPHAQPQSTCWNGCLLKENEKLLIVSEQGLGDTIQFMRYIPYLVKQGFDISFCAQQKLHGLIKISGIHPTPLCPEQARTISQGKWISLLSLPEQLGVQPSNPIINQIYISTKKTMIDKWESTLSKEKQAIIGINWQGNPDVEKNELVGRSLPLDTFSTLARATNFKFLSLQKGYGSEQLNSCSFRDKFVSCQKEVDNTWGFLETAAIIMNCDLIITSDTSVAHLAGGLGKRTWLLLKDVPEWRWGVKQETTFWYPSIKLFRQKEKHNWHEVMERVSIELQKTIRSDS